jgi:hypothetical protein
VAVDTESALGAYIARRLVMSEETARLASIPGQNAPPPDVTLQRSLRSIDLQRSTSVVGKERIQPSAV